MHGTTAEEKKKLPSVVLSGGKSNSVTCYLTAMP
jgi:hypothetical protein